MNIYLIQLSLWVFAFIVHTAAIFIALYNGDSFTIKDFTITAMGATLIFAFLDLSQRDKSE